MARQSYHVVDSNDKKIGILFLDASSEAPAAIGNLFQSTASNPFDEPTTHIEKFVETKNFWASDGATAMILGSFIALVLLIYSWYYNLGGGGWIAGGAILGAVGLHALKIWLHRPPRPEASPTPNTHKITIETVENYGHSRHVLLDEIEDTSITVDELRRVARAYADGTSFARAPMMIKARISDGKYRKIKREFERLNLLFTDKGSRNHLSLRGQAVLRQLASGD